MKKKFKVQFLDPGAILAVIVTLLILAVGIVAFSVTLENIPVTNETEEQLVEEEEDPVAVDNEMLFEEPPQSGYGLLINFSGILMMLLGILGVLYFANKSLISYRKNRDVYYEREKRKKRIEARRRTAIKEKKPELDIKPKPSKKKPKKTKTKSFNEWGKSDKGDFNI